MITLKASDPPTLRSGLGKVRTELVKRISLELMERYPNAFSADFEQNKRVLMDLNLDISKRLRNRVAGYIARTMKRRKAVEEAPVEG
jgi:small subunit ribosomal protein S17e